MTIKKAYADTQAGQIHYRYVPGEGVPLLFFHRTPASSISFEKMMTLLHGDRPLYAFDTPGFGASFVPPGMPLMPDYAAYMMAAVDVLEIDRCHIFAHHTGTHFATEMAAAHPDRVMSLMLNGIAYMTAAERLETSKTIKDPMPPDPDAKYARATWQSVNNLFTEFDPELTPIEFLGALGSLTGRKQGFNAVWNQNYPEVLAKVTCPILATCAEDEWLRPYFERLREERPDIKALVLGKARFFTPEYDAERAVAAIREFLSEIE